MKSIILCSLAAMTFYLVGCDNSAKPTAATQPAAATKTETAVSANPPKIDAVALLQGKWQSTEDAKSAIVIAGKGITNIFEGKKMGTNVFKFIADCSDSACNGGASKVGCFTSAGEMDIDCFSIISLSETELQVSMAGATGNTLKYTKVK